MSWAIELKLIDGSTVVLAEFKSKAEARRTLSWLLRDERSEFKGKIRTYKIVKRGD